MVDFGLLISLTSRFSGHYHSSMRRSRHTLSILAITALSIVIYANTLKNGFVYDDIDTIVNNVFIKDFSNLSGLFEKNYFALSGETSYRPVVTFSYFIDYVLYGNKPWGYHLTNIILHAVNGVLLYLFLLYIMEPAAAPVSCMERPFFTFFGPTNAPVAISLLFISHPVLTEAVNGISFREDLLAFGFYIATLILYVMIRSGAASASRFKLLALYILSCLAYLAALLSKEMALTLPIIIYCFEWIYNDSDETPIGPFNFYNIGYIAISAFYVYLRFYLFANPAPEELPNWNLLARLQTIPLLLLNYVKLILFPTSLSTDYRIAPLNSIYSLLFIISLIVVAALVSIAFIVKKKKEKEATFGIFFFIITLLPVYNIIRITNPFAERYAYLPTAGAIIASISGVSRIIFKSGIKPKLTKYSGLYPFMLILLIMFFSFMIIERNTVWRNDFLLWSDTAKKIPGSSRAHYNLGYYNYEMGRVERAIEEYKTVLRLKPDHRKAANNLGLIYFNNGSYAEALIVYENILTKFPNDKFLRAMREEVLKKIAKRFG